MHMLALFYIEMPAVISKAFRPMTRKPTHLQASRSSMSQEVLMVSRSSAYFHLERSYLRLAAEAAAEAAAAEDRFSWMINRDCCYFTSFHFIGEEGRSHSLFLDSSSNLSCPSYLSHLT